jgi:hypothetical protein
MFRIGVPRFSLGLLALLGVACSKDPPKSATPAPSVNPKGDAGAPVGSLVPSSASVQSFPAFEPAPLASLVAQAKGTPPQGDATPYAPREVEVPPVRVLTEELLPKVGNQVVLGESTKLVLSFKATRDPVTASARCMELTTGCLQSSDTENARDRDSCVASAKTCDTNHPWDEAEACCPERCQQFYAELRMLGYPDQQAWTLVRSSDCVPGMSELRQVARDKDEAAKMAPVEAP